MSDQLQYERFLWFHGRIKAEKFPNSSHLAEQFEIVPRTAQRAIEFMRDRLAAPLVYDHRRRGYYYRDATFEVPGHWITETNVLALVLAVRLASTIPDPALKDDLCRLIDRVTGANAKAGKEARVAAACLSHIDDRISVKNIEYARVNTQVFRQAVEALFGGRTLAITYHSPHSDTTTRRTVRPLHLVHYMGSWYMPSWCATRQAIRSFALARISRIGPAPQELPLPADLPPMKDYSRRHFGIIQGDHSQPVTLHFSPKIAPLIAEQIWHHDQQASATPDGGLLLTFPAADFRELAGTILRHGAEVRVIEPEELQKVVRKEIAKMAKIYFPV